MDKKRINILTPIPFWHPGTHELIEGLNNNNISVVALDIWSFKYYNENHIVKNLAPNFLKGLPLRIYKRLFRKRIIKKYINKNDIVDIQWCGHYYSKYIKHIKDQAHRTYATLFGSDLYRTKQEDRAIQREIFEIADFIVMGVNMDGAFLTFFPGFENKILHAQYGSYRLEMIDQMTKDHSKESIKTEFGISSYKTVVTLGYNSKQEQQHLLFLHILEKLPVNIKNRLFLILPLTYGKENDDYLNGLRQSIKEAGIEYLLLENRLSDTDLVKTKLVSDITVNLQTTDALASSIKEAFAAYDIVIVGDWLPYDIYKDLGVFFISSDLTQLKDIFIDVVENIDNYKEKCQFNKQRILEFASWKYLIPQFIKNYNL